MIRACVAMLPRTPNAWTMNISVRIERVFHINGSQCVQCGSLDFFVILLNPNRCDNIKDCLNAEDEEDCVFCDDGEFR